MISGSARPDSGRRAELTVLGSDGEVIVGGDASTLRAVVSRAHAVERALTRPSDSGELADLLDRPERWVRVSRDLMSALRWYKRMHAETGGLLDPSQHAGTEGLRLRSEDAKAWVRAGTRVDLALIGAGLVLDLAVREGMHCAARFVMIRLGDDRAAAGELPGGIWDVPVIDPRSRLPYAHGRLRGGALMSRAPASAAVRVDDVVTATVAAPSAARAEALAAAAVRAGVADATRMLSRADVGAWLLLDDDRVVTVTASAPAAAFV